MINRRLRNNRWLVVVVAACAMLAAGASAEERAGKADETAPSGRSTDSGAAAKNVGAGRRDSGPLGNRGVAGGATLRAPMKAVRLAEGRRAKAVLDRAVLHRAARQAASILFGPTTATPAYGTERRGHRPPPRARKRALR